jgi:hypothetical protein
VIKERKEEEGYEGLILPDIKKVNAFEGGDSRASSKNEGMPRVGDLPSLDNN